MHFAILPGSISATRLPGSTNCSWLTCWPRQVWAPSRHGLRTNNAGSQQIPVDLPGDQFWQFNFWLGYRFRRNVGDISVGLLNATGIDYRLDPLNAYAELPRERVVAARVRLRF